MEILFYSIIIGGGVLLISIVGPYLYISGKIFLKRLLESKKATESDR